MKHVILYLFVAVAFLLHSNYASWLKQGEDYELTGPLTDFDEVEGSGEGETDVNCTGVTGSICSDNYAKCNLTFLCIPGTEGPIPGSPCPLGQTCNKGKCSAIPSTLCEYRGLKFKCNSEGMFPEPSNCKKYNYCVPPGNATAIEGNCPAGWAYNTANTLCDKKLPANMMCPDIDRAVPRCTTAGQNAALKASNSYYYICLPYGTTETTLYPSIYRCPGNKKYAGNYVCK